MGTHGSSLSLCCTIHSANVYRIPFMLPSGRPRGRVAGFPWLWQEAGGGAKNLGWSIRWPGFPSVPSLTSYHVWTSGSLQNTWFVYSPERLWKSREIGKLEYYKKFFFKNYETLGSFFETWESGVQGWQPTMVAPFCTTQGCQEDCVLQSQPFEWGWSGPGNKSYCLFSLKMSALNSSHLNLGLRPPLALPGPLWP